MSLRKLLLCIGIATASSGAWSREALHIVGPGGKVESLLRTEVLPRFSGERGVNFIYEAIDDEKLVERLTTEPTSGIADVIIATQQGIDIAVANGGCVEVEDSEDYGDLYGLAKFGSLGVGIGLETTVIAYSPLSFSRNKWPVPARWSDLLNSTVPLKVYLPSDFRRTSAHTLLMLARATGGSDRDLERAFENIAQSRLMTSGGLTSAEIGQRLATGEIDVTVMSSVDAYQLKKSGSLIEYVYPDGGLAAEIMGGCVSGGRAMTGISQELLRDLISVAVQTKIASLGYGPTNHDTELDNDLARQLPYGRARVASMVSIDWFEITKNRSVWGGKWSEILMNR